jgi:hypothetical protein
MKTLWHVFKRSNALSEPTVGRPGGQSGNRSSSSRARRDEGDGAIADPEKVVWIPRASIRFKLKSASIAL